MKIQNLTIIAVFFIVASLTLAHGTSNTLFIESGLPGGTTWNVNVYSYQNANYNNNFNSNTNIVSANIPAGSYYWIASTTTNVINEPSVIIGANNLVNFARSITVNSVNVASYQFCIDTACINYQGQVPQNASSLQNRVLGPPYSGNLTIYFNPAGFYEYVINNGTGTINPVLYQNIPPGQLQLPQINLTNFNNLYSQSFNSLTKNTNVSTNTSYVGAIYYSQLIDISPVEYRMLNGTLTPYNFFNWVLLNSPSFYNTTLVFKTGNPNIISKTILGTPAIVGTLGDVLAVSTSLPGLLACFFGYCPSNLLNGAKTYVLRNIQAEISTPVSYAVPISLANINYSERNLHLFVTYAYPSYCLNSITSVLQNGVCMESGTQGMLDFNTYIDTTYAPQIVTSQFLSSSIPTLLIITLAIFIIRKINGN